MKKITVYGVGLIGGSLARCFKDLPGVQVTGHSHRQEMVQTLLSLGVVDKATNSFEEAAHDADFIFLCVPVGIVEKYLQQLSELDLKPGCIITDVGSTKSSITQAGLRLKFSKDVHFIGGHPMAGSERSGVEAADPHLFENAYYVLTPYDHTPESAYERLVACLEPTRAHIVRMRADEHDAIVAAISHLPHIIAVQLVNQVARHSEKSDFYERLAAGGFRDITRIASSDPALWRDILIDNRKQLIPLLREWIEDINDVIGILEKAEGHEIEKMFSTANQFRTRLPERKRGAILPTYELFVDIPDTPGILGKITTELGNAGINLSNIQIHESREDEPAVLRLSFRRESDLHEAAKILQNQNYPIHFLN